MPNGPESPFPEPSPESELSPALAQQEETKCRELVRSVGEADANADAKIARLKADAAGQVACKQGCDSCCHRIVVVGVAELFRIAEGVRASFSAAEQGALLDRCRQYVSDSLPFRDGRQLMARPACPLLVDHRCSIYDSRPLGCRGWNSYSAQECEKRLTNATAPIPLGDLRQNAAAQSCLGDHMRDLEWRGLPHHLLDLGLALPELLENPVLTNRYMEGESILLEHAVIQPGPDPIRQARLSSSQARAETSGFASMPAPPGHVVYEFLRLTTPTSYSSQDHIESSLARYRRMIDQFAEIPVDAGQAFDGLSQFQTFGLPYSGEDVTDLLRAVGEKIVCPIVALALPDLVVPIEPRKPEGRLRVGYLSRNMSQHHSTNFTMSWMLRHGEDIESFVFHIGAAQDATSLQFRIAADHFYHLPGGVPSTARFIKSLGLDVMVFPDIGNFGENYQYAGMRLAAVQCTSWGQPVTSGLSTIDYYLSSALMEPEDGDAHYTEQLIRLPGPIHWNRNNTPPSTKSRAELGIPDGQVYFVAQNIRKLVPKWDRLYAEIQSRTGAPILFIDPGGQLSADVTRERIKNAGVKAIWLPRLSQADFVRAQQLCDVSLDPPAWSGGNTTETGLRVGRPIVTLPGPFMRGRHNLAFMPQANVAGLIANSPEDYVDLATDFDRLDEIMKGLNVEGLSEDASEPPAIDAFLRKVTGRG
jgi:Fe-S-cluster containining protein